jgi:hypothetical protein
MFVVKMGIFIVPIDKGTFLMGLSVIEWRISLESLIPLRLGNENEECIELGGPLVLVH